MNLRAKTFIIIAAVFIGAFLVMAGVLGHFITSEYIRHETQVINENMQQAKLFIMEEILNSIDNTAKDWAKWDDTYQFIQDHNTEYLESNFSDSTFFDNRFNLAVIIDTGGNIVFGEYYRWIPGESTDATASLELADIPDELQPYLKPGSPLMILSDNDKGTRGIVSLPYAPMIICGR